MPTIRRIRYAEPGLISGLCGLLQDSVHGGASVGFLAPLSAEAAQRYWQQVMAALGEGLGLWVAEEDGAVAGAVQLAPCLIAPAAKYCPLQGLSKALNQGAVRSQWQALGKGVQRRVGALLKPRTCCIQKTGRSVPARCRVIEPCCRVITAAFRCLALGRHRPAEAGNT